MQVCKKFSTRYTYQENRFYLLSFCFLYHLSFDKYFNSGNITIPQYNFRVGYYFKPNWDISFGIDHMKYVLDQNQITKNIWNY